MIKHHIDINWFGEAASQDSKSQDSDSQYSDNQEQEPPGQRTTAIHPQSDVAITACDITTWLNTALNILDLARSEVSVAVVSEEDIETINHEFRGKKQPTNVLSFPHDIDSMPCLDDDGSSMPFLGDIICCATIIEKEAERYDMSAEKRWAHMLVHGLLHLLGMDHLDDASRATMEQQEILILEKLGFSNPYIN